MEQVQFSKGDIVALLSHPYDDTNTDILISGDPLQQSPLLIVTQILAPKDASSGEPRNYKCMWFSGKSQKFEETWILQPLLKLVKKAEDILEAIPDIGTRLLLRTCNLEVSKKKSSFFAENSSTETEKQTTNISPLLSFVSPVLLVTGFKNVEKDKGENIGRTDKDFNLIKVMWFNLSGDKMSEVFLPVSAVIEIPPVEADSMNSIKEALENNSLLKVKLVSGITFLKPLSINYLNGSYFLRSFDFVRNRLANNLNLNEIEIIELNKEPALERAPQFNFAIKTKPILSATQLIKKAIKEKNCVRLKYANQYGVQTVRSVKNFSIDAATEGKDDVKYLTGYCLVKNGQRHFNIARINWIEMIDLKWNNI